MATIKIIQRKYTNLLLVFASFFLFSVNGSVIRIQNNDFVSVTSSDDEYNKKWICCKSSTQTTTAWGYRISSWGFGLSKVVCGGVGELLNGISTSLYHAYHTPIQSKEIELKVSEKPKKSFLRKSGELGGKFLIKTAILTTFAATKVNSTGWHWAEKTWEVCEDASYRRFENYRKENNQVIQDNGNDFGIIAFDEDYFLGSTEVQI